MFLTLIFQMYCKSSYTYAAPLTHWPR